MKRWLIALAASASAALLISRLPPEAVPGAAPAYLLAVVLAAFLGGFGPGLFSAALVLGHSWYYRTCVAPSHFHFGCFALESLVLGAPVTALLVGWLRLQADKRLEEARRSAQALAEAEAVRRRDALQRELIANVSHEFRTPIAAIKGFTESLQGGAAEDPAARAEFLAIIGRHTERLSRLVESLLDLAVLDCDACPPEPREIELEGFLRTLSARLAPRAAEKGVSVGVGAAAGSVSADPEHLGRIMDALCGNAIEHNLPGGRVLLSAGRAGDWVEVRVEDTGPGIPKESLPHLFEPFSQRKGRRPGVGGSGLGLPVAAALAHANGGRVRLERTGPRGTHVLVELPAAGPVTSAPAARLTSRPMEEDNDAQ